MHTCHCRVWVRAAPSLRFTYVEPQLMPLWLRFFPPSRAPSMLARMPLAEFAMRSQQCSPLPPLFYPSTHQQQQQQDRHDQKLGGGQTGHGSGGAADGGTDPAQREYYYMQTPLNKRLAQDCDLDAPPFRLVHGSGQAPEIEFWLVNCPALLPWPHLQRSARQLAGNAAVCML